MASPSQSRSQTSASSASERLEDLLSGTDEGASFINPDLFGTRAEEDRPRGVIIEEITGEDEGTSHPGPWQDVPIPQPSPVTYLPSNMAQPTTLQVPTLFASLPAIRDLLQTDTTLLQDETLEEVIPFLNGTSDELSPSSYNSYGIASLDRARHANFLHKSLQSLPGAYTAADAARPWFFYWAICGLRVLGEDVSGYAERLVETTRATQNFGGGFGGGHGMMSHLASTYATTLALAMVGERKPGESEEMTEERRSLVYGAFDRRKMWEWLGDLKSADGGFAMCVGGEIDVRGAYCAVTLITLLNLPIELPPDCLARKHMPEGSTLLTDLSEYVSRCQTHEGGISSRPDGEAHGAYAFCAMACLAILGKPNVIIPKYLNIPLLISWLSARQYAPEGGFAGRTNKLVDGCYSHWIGGCWPILEAVLKSPTLQTGAYEKALYSREGLIRYILCCCQDTTRRGGLRDKPSKNSDAYHTCYVLAGLSSAQHSWSCSSSPKESTKDAGNILTAPYQWYPNPTTGGRATYDYELSGTQVFDESERVGVLHPVFVIPQGAVDAMRKWFVNDGEIAV